MENEQEKNFYINVYGLMHVFLHVACYDYCKCGIC